MNEWQFWDDGITGLFFMFLGVVFITSTFYDLPKNSKDKETDPKKIKRKCRLFKIGGVVFFVFGLMTLLGYITL